MKRSSHIVAVCGLTAALSLVLMALGSALGVFTYVCPILAGVLLLCVREELGTRWAVTLWAAIGLLALILVPEPEMAAVFIGIFGWYPAAKPFFDGLPRALGWAGKLLSFNAAATAVYALLMKVVGLQDMPGSAAGLLLLLAMGNVLFLCYDFLLKRLQVTLVPRLRRLLRWS